MKRFLSSNEARRSLLEMRIDHPHPHVRHRTQALVQRTQGITQTQAVQEFGVHRNSLRDWMQRWGK